MFPLLFDLRPNYGGGNEDNSDLLQKVPCRHCYTQCPQPCSRPPPTHASTETLGHSRASLSQSLVGSLLLSPGSWCIQGSVCALQESVSPVLCEFWWFYGGVNGDLLQQGLCPTEVCCALQQATADLYFQETLRHSSGSVSVGWACILCPSQV